MPGSQAELVCVVAEILSRQKPQLKHFIFIISSRLVGSRETSKIGSGSKAHAVFGS